MKYRNLSYKRVQQLSRNYVIFIILACLVVFTINWHFLRTNGHGWMTYRYDNARSAITTEKLTLPLSLRWTFKPTHAPKMAYPEAAEGMERMHQDNAYYVIAANGKVYFGSSVNNKIYALNASTGKIQWTFYTEGPVRFAPTIWKGKVYVGSDDGYVYCLNAKDGKLVWKYRAGASDEKVIGNERMISLWPIRTSVLVDEGIVYFAAGIFPYEGIYICALNADDGRIVWKNDTMGDHAHELQYGGISPQGYLVASENVLYVPSGRAMPAAFLKKNGQFLYYCSPGAKRGGTWALLDKSNLLAGVDHSGTPTKISYDEQTGERKDDVHAWFQGINLVVTPEVSYTLTEDGIYAIDRSEYLLVRNKRYILEKELQQLKDNLSDLMRRLFYDAADDETRNKLNKQRNDISQRISDQTEEEGWLKASTFKWKYLKKHLSSLILAGNVMFAGGDGIVVALNKETGEELWKTEMEGTACGLATTDGNLFVSADNGNVYCFGEGGIFKTKENKSTISLWPYQEDRLSHIYESAVEAIVKGTGINKGYCLVLNAGTGRLAFELAKRTNLNIVGIEKDLKKVKVAKIKLDEAGLYGARIVIEPWDLSTLPDYFANLIVSDEMTISGNIECSAQEILRVLKPYGGVAYLGQPTVASDDAKSSNLEYLLKWLKNSGTLDYEVSQENGFWVKVARGELKGAGSWTQQYGNPQNTACSGDELVNGPLGVLWFGRPGPKGMVERHARATSPVSINGRLFIQGEEVIRAYDAYNGTLLWEKEIPGAVRVRADLDCGNLSITEDGLFVGAYDKCYRLDPATGETVRVYDIPQSNDRNLRRWGYVSCTGNILYGSTATPLKEEYAAFWKNCVDNGKWKNIDEIPSQNKIQYEYYKSRQPVPDEKLWEELHRHSGLWRGMANWPIGGEYTIEGAKTDNIQMTSDKIFAIDLKTGNLLWIYNGNKIANITICIGDGKIFFAESEITKEEKKRALKYKQELLMKGLYKNREGIVRDLKVVKKELMELMKEKNPDNRQVSAVTYRINAIKAELFKEENEEGLLTYDDTDVRLVIALDAVTGRKLWEKPVDLTGCCGDKMGSAYHNGLLLFFGNLGNHTSWKFKEGALKWRRITALSSDNGDIQWSRALNYRTRPVIVGNKIIIEPRACDLQTGEIIMRSHPITGKEVPWEFLRPGHTCAITAASADGLFYRSQSTAFYDLEEDRGVALFGAIRPGCLINVIPAGGVLLFPEASSGCTCSHPLKTSLALKRKQQRFQPWTVFITHGAMTPVKQFAVNLGAPADMRDKEGTVWFGYPNPNTEHYNHFPNYGVKFDLHDKILRGMGYFCSDFKDKSIEGSQKPWLFSSGCLGILQYKMQLIDDTWGEEPGIYTVRLGFNAPNGDNKGNRIFDIKLQGNTVIKDFDIFETAKAPNRAVIKEFNEINVKDTLTIDLVPKVPNPNIKQAPILNFIEVIRKDEVEITETPITPTVMKSSDARALLIEAKKELARKNDKNALDMYHKVLDSAPSTEIKLNALEGMTVIGSTMSLTRIKKYCRDVSPILWQYNEPEPELRDSAFQVYFAIVNNIAKENKQRAIKMLICALQIVNSDTRKDIVSRLKNLGVEIDEYAD